MGLAWKGLIPLGLVNLFLVAAVFTFDLNKHFLAVTIVTIPIAGLISTWKLQRELNTTLAVRAGKSGFGGASA
jgi:uncharacterized membrane protein